MALQREILSYGGMDKKNVNNIETKHLIYVIHKAEKQEGTQ